MELAGSESRVDGGQAVNSRGLPVLDSTVLDALFSAAASGRADASYLGELEARSRDWFRILLAHQAFNLAYRQAFFRRLARFVEPSVGKLEGPVADGWLAMALAIKEAYGMSDNTLERVMREVRLRP